MSNTKTATADTPGRPGADERPYASLELDGVPPDFTKVVKLMADGQAAALWLRDGEESPGPEGRVHWTRRGTDAEGRWVDFTVREPARYRAPSDIKKLTRDASGIESDEATDISGAAFQLWKHRELRGVWLSAPRAIDRYCLVTEIIPENEAADLVPTLMKMAQPIRTTDGDDETPGVLVGLFRLRGRQPAGADGPCGPEEIAELGRDRIWIPDPMLETIFCERPTSGS